MIDLSAAVGRDVVAAWDFFVHLAVVLLPLFVGGSFLVGALQEYVPPERVEGLLRRYDGGSGNLVAAGVGAVTPFCSCSTVPVLAGLLSAGTPLGTAFSFLLASPVVNELAVVLLVGLFGVETAAAYVALTLTTAVVAGVVVGHVGLADHVKATQLAAGSADGAVTDGGCCPSADDPGRTPCSTGDAADPCAGVAAPADAGCSAGAARNDPHAARLRRAAEGAASFFVDLLPYLVLGMTLGAIVHGFVPASLVRRVIGPENPLAVPIAAVVGAPIYVSMSAMLPLAATFAESGIPIGTVLAFVVGSAGVSVPNLILLNKLFDRYLLAVYALTVVTTGVVVGLLFNAVVA